MDNLHKACPKCGLVLVDQDFVESNFINKKKQSSSLLLSPTANSLMIPKFEIAYQGPTERQQHGRVILNMEEVDSFLNLIISDTLLIIGETRFTNLLISRLYVNASLNYSFRSKLQPKRIDNNSKERVSASVMVIDAGNSTDFYLVINFARQYGLDIKKFLQNVIISRMFTVEQLANTIINQIQKIIKDHYSRIKVIAVINLLTMFINDPNLNDTESRLLIRQILDSLNKISKEFNILVIVSCTQTKYDRLVSRRFLKIIRMSTVNGNGGSQKRIRLELTVGPRRHIRSIVLQEKDLRTISKIQSQ